MQAHGFVRNLRTLLIGVSPVIVAACGGTTISVGGGSSSGGTSTTLAGTFFGNSGTSQRSIPPISPATSTAKDSIFGVVASDGSGFFADTQTAGHQAIFSMGTASSTGSSAVSGFFNAYAANGSDLGDSTTIATSPDGGLTGTLSSTSTGGTQAALNYAFPDGYSNAATIILDNPALAQTTIATGTYSASNIIAGTTAVATTAISTNASDTYTVNFNSATSFTVSTAGGCIFTGTASPDATLNIYHLDASGGCNGTNIPTLTGLASFLPINGHSPLGGVLTKNTLVLELDDSESGIAPKYALALVAAQ